MQTHFNDLDVIGHTELFMGQPGKVWQTPLAIAMPPDQAGQRIQAVGLMTLLVINQGVRASTSWTTMSWVEAFGRVISVRIGFFS